MRTPPDHLSVMIESVPPLFELSFVIPLYNSADTIETVLQEIDRIEVQGGKEVVLVNDGSRDGTTEVVAKMAARMQTPVRLVEHSRNYGEHNAILTGLRQADGRYIVTMDDDMQNPPMEAFRLYQSLKERNLDVVFSSYASKKHENWRNLGSRFTNWISEFVLDKPKGLYLSSFRCMNRFVAKTIVDFDGPYPYVDGLILQTTQRIGTLEVAHQERAGGQSGYTMGRLIRLWTSMFVNFSVMPLRVATGIGFGLSAFGLLSAFFVVIENLFFGTPLGWGSMMAGLLVFSGIQLLLLGLIGEYIGRSFLTLNRKPQSVVRTTQKWEPGARVDDLR
jgi:glycosyltransferase involved in cell wall biosynthesis